MKKVEKNPLAMAIITFIACILAILLVMGVISLISKKLFAEGIDPTILIFGGIASVGSAVAEYLTPSTRWPATKPATARRSPDC